MTDAIRWRQRFENFERAFRLLREAFEKDPSQMSDLEKEGVVQRFEYTFELAWKNPVRATDRSLMPPIRITILTRFPATA